MADKPNTTIVAKGAASSNPSYLEWGPVWAGALVAIAITTILVQFGAGVGLSMGEAIRPDNTVSYNFIVAGLWLLLISVASSSIAGYIAGRMRMTMNDANANEVEFRDGIHGISAWALSTVIIAVLVAITGGIAAALTQTVASEIPERSLELQNWETNQTVIMAFATAAGATLGAAASWAASVTGGKHRNEGSSFHDVVPSVFRKK